MIQAIVLQILFRIGLASPGNAGMAPEAMYDAALLRDEPPACREPSTMEQQERGVGGRGKASTYSLDGVYLCERTIFDYGQRDSYSEFLLAQAPARALLAARAAEQLLTAQPKLKNRIWTVSVTSGPADLRPHLERVYRQALSQALAGVRIGRASTPARGGVSVLVAVRPAIEADLLFAVTAKSVEGEAQHLWSL